MFRSLFLGAVLACLNFPAGRAETETFKIGYILDMSGLYADITGKGSVEAARIAVEDFGGSVLGRPIEVVYADHQNKADIAANTAREWRSPISLGRLICVPFSAKAASNATIERTKQYKNRERHQMLLIDGGS